MVFMKFAPGRLLQVLISYHALSYQMSSEANLSSTNMLAEVRISNIPMLLGFT